MGSTDGLLSTPLEDCGGIALRLGVGRRTVERWVGNHEIPFFRVGRLVRFDVTEVEDWLQARRVQAR